ncbi:MAG: hypothetical protein ABIH83_04205 [Candidatus Micrarchaeota archaeon]
MECTYKQQNGSRNNKQNKLNSTFLKMRELLPDTINKLMSKNSAEFEVALQTLKSKLEKQPAGILSLHELIEICEILKTRFWDKETSEDMRFKISDVIMLLPDRLILRWKKKIYGSGVPVVSDEIRNHICQKSDTPPEQKRDYKRVVILGEIDEVFAECDKIHLEHIFAKRGLFDTRIYISDNILGVIDEIIGCESAKKKIACCVLSQCIKYSFKPFRYLPSEGSEEIKFFRVEDFGKTRNWQHVLDHLVARRIDCKVFLLQVLPDKKLEEIVKKFSLDIEIMHPVEFREKTEDILDKKGIFENC